MKPHGFLLPPFSLSSLIVLCPQVRGGVCSHAAQFEHPDPHLGETWKGVWLHPAGRKCGSESRGDFLRAAPRSRNR